VNKKLPSISNQDLFQQALTHRSYTNEIPTQQDNERLEFLGDAVLGFLIGELLYRRYPELDEAQLTRLRSMLVDQKQLAKIAQEMDIGRLIRLGKGADKCETRNSPAVLSDTFEAIIGAYFLDTDITTVSQYVDNLFTPIIEEILSTKSAKIYDYLTSAKNLLQEWAIVNIGENPYYKLVNESGPSHAKTFTVEVQIKGIVYGTGQGQRKQEAEKQAALTALQKLSII